MKSKHSIPYQQGAKPPHTSSSASNSMPVLGKTPQFQATEPSEK